MTSRTIAELLELADHIIQVHGGALAEVSHKDHVKVYLNAIFERARTIRRYDSLHHTVLEQKLATVWSFEVVEKVIRKWIISIYAGSQYLQGKVDEDVVLWLKLDVFGKVVFFVALENDRNNFEPPQDAEFIEFTEKKFKRAIIVIIRKLRKDGKLISIKQEPSDD